jgi:hypothetical protein
MILIVRVGQNAIAHIPVHSSSMIVLAMSAEYPNGVEKHEPSRLFCRISTTAAGAGPEISESFQLRCGDILEVSVNAGDGLMER